MMTGFVIFEGVLGLASVKLQIFIALSTSPNVIFITTWIIFKNLETFFQKIGGHQPFLGPLVNLFQTSGNISPDFQTQGRAPLLSALLLACDEFLRFTSSVTPTYL